MQKMFNERNVAMNLIFLGDSLTFGYGLHTNDRFVNIIKANLNYNIINKGVNGDTTSGLLSRVDKDVLCYNPNFCSLLIGTNDFLSNRSVDYVFDNISFLTKDLLSHNITPIICTPPPTFSSLATLHWCATIDYDNVNLKIHQLQKRLSNFCTENNYIFIDFFSLITTNICKNIFSDGIHLNPKGNLLLADFWQKSFISESNIKSNNLS